MTTKSADLFDRYFYLIMSLVIAGVVIYGFSHTINENLIHPAYPRPLVLYFHAAIFTGWVALMITQSALIRARNIKLHRKLGLCALALAVALPIIGIATGIVWTAVENRVILAVAALSVRALSPDQFRDEGRSVLEILIP